VGKGEEDVPLGKEPVAHEASREVVGEAQQVERLDHLANLFGHLCRQNTRDTRDAMNE
jgi:hypothetical protein